MKNKWLVILSIGFILIVIVLYILGFRITYSPGLENNWTAIDAVGTWVGVLSPIILAIINASYAKDIERTKNEISSSNRIIYERKMSPENSLTEKTMEQKILDYITVSITATTKDISEIFKMDINDVFDLLYQEVKNLIIGINRRKNVDKSKVIWKIFR